MIRMAHPGPTKRVHIYGLHTKAKLDTKLDRWSRSGTQNVLEDLIFHGGKLSSSLPWSAFHFAPKLRIARLWSCYFLEFHLDPLLVLGLNQHELYNIPISEAANESLVVDYIALEGLQLQRIHRLRTLYIVSPSIRMIDVFGFEDPRALMILRELVIQDARD
jgi:hypothetical protein